MSKLVIDDHSEHTLSCLKNGTGADTSGTLVAGGVDLIQTFTFQKGVIAVKKILLASALRPQARLLAVVSKYNTTPINLVNSFGSIISHAVILANQSQATEVTFTDYEFPLTSEQFLSLYVGCADQLLTSIWTVSVTVFYKNARWS